MQITIKNYTKVIQGAIILQDINITFKSGTVYGFHGVNGCGKTMLMRAICGLIHPTKGSIYFDNKKLFRDLDFPESIGALIENPSFLPHLTGMQNLQLLADLKICKDKNSVSNALCAVGLSPRDKRKFRKYSLGMKQRLGIAGAILQNPDIIILDEPLNALDIDGVKKVYGIIQSAKEHGAIVILACHNKEDLSALADEFICMENGKVISVLKQANLNLIST